jgi:hypothetical protein
MNNQGCTYPGHQTAKFNKFCTLAPNIGEARVWGLLHVIVQVSIILNRLPDFWKICTIRMSPTMTPHWSLTSMGYPAIFYWHFVNYVVHWAAKASEIFTEEIIHNCSSTFFFQMCLKFETRNVWISSVAENQLYCRPPNFQSFTKAEPFQVPWNIYP